MLEPCMVANLTDTNILKHVLFSCWFFSVLIQYAGS